MLDVGDTSDICVLVVTRRLCNQILTQHLILHWWSPGQSQWWIYTHQNLCFCLVNCLYMIFFFVCPHYWSCDHNPCVDGVLVGMVFHHLSGYTSHIQSCNWLCPPLDISHLGWSVSQCNQQYCIFFSLVGRCGLLQELHIHWLPSACHGLWLGYTSVSQILVLSLKELTQAWCRSLMHSARQWSLSDPSQGLTPTRPIWSDWMWRSMEWCLSVLGCKNPWKGQGARASATMILTYVSRELEVQQSTSPLNYTLTLPRHFV